MSAQGTGSWAEPLLAPHGIPGQHRCYLAARAREVRWQRLLRPARPRRHHSGRPLRSADWVDLGDNRTTMIDSGSSFTCALLDNGDVKCWGRGVTAV